MILLSLLRRGRTGSKLACHWRLCHSGVLRPSMGTTRQAQHDGVRLRPLESHSGGVDCACCCSGAAAATAWWFRGYDMGRQPPFAEVLIAVSWGPLLEEVTFRGYLFSLLERLLKRWLSSPGWLIVVGIAAVFALSHLIKSGITPVQVATVFLTGTLYGWLRLATGSTVPPVCSHISYNSVIYLAAAFLR
jgi:hypothetical protein